jgi:hypothetical protein
MRGFLFGTLVLAACAGNGSMAGGGGGGGGGSGGDGGGGDTTADIEQDYNDVASSLGAVASVPELTAMTDSVVLSYGGMPDGLSPSGAGVVAGARNGLTFQYKYHCHDASDAMIACGPGVDHGHTYPTISGDLSSEEVSISNLDHTSDWTIKNLQAQTPTIDRLGKLAFSASLASDSSTIDFMIDGTWSKVHFQPMPSMPSDGTITMAITAHRSRASAALPDRDFTANAVVTFASGGTTIALDGTHQYSVDLTSGAVTRL